MNKNKVKKVLKPVQISKKDVKKVVKNVQEIFVGKKR